MSVVARPARSVVARCPRFLQSCRWFHSSTPRRKKSRFKNITAEKMGLIPGSPKLDEHLQANFPDYTDIQKQALRSVYTQEQLAAIEAGENAISATDLALQGRLRDDRYRPGYFDDFAKVQPVLDLKGPPPRDAVSERVRWLDQDEWVSDYIDKLSARVEKRVEKTLAGSMVRALRAVKTTQGDLIDVTEDELLEFEKDPETAKKLLESQLAQRPSKEQLQINPDVIDLEEAERLSGLIDKAFWSDLEGKFENDRQNPLMPSKIEAWREIDLSDDIRTSAYAADIKRIPGFEDMYEQNKDEDTENEANPDQARRMERVTGMKIRDINNLMIKVLHSTFVTNQTRLGKVSSTRICTIAGNCDGWVGFGVGKSTQAETAMLTAKLLAVRNMRPVRRYENRTIYGNLKAKVSGTIVTLQARPPGWGLRVPSRIFEICRAAGIHDLGATIPRSRNPLNTVKACFDALNNQLDPEEIALGRGRKMVDARKVYYGGNVT